jgi:multiple sugar transport system ATP-binding protein
VGKSVVFGIRPEDIHDRHLAPPGITAEHLAVTVDVTELMGNEVFLYLVTGGKTFIARVDPRTSARIGQQLDVSFNMANVHFFDRESEKTIA